MNAVELLSRRVEAWTGLALERLGRRGAIAALIRTRARVLGAGSLDAYVRALGGRDDPEVLALMGLAGSGARWFLQPPEDLESVARLLRRAPRRRLRVWIAGCGTGEEAWAVAMLARSLGRTAEVLATDHDEAALGQARAGRYAAWALRTFPSAFRGSLAVTADNRLQIVGPAREWVTFAKRSLVDAPPSPEVGGWDLILCRAPLPFLRPARALRTLEAMAARLEHHGAVVLDERDLPARALARLDAGGFERLTVLHGRGAGGRNLVVARRSRIPLARMLDAGSERLRDGAFAEALPLFDEAARRAPLCAEAHLLAGMARHRLGDHASAARALRGALFLAPELWPAAYHLALSLEALGEPGAARDAWARVVEAVGRDARAAPSSPLLADLESWKPDVVALARRRMRRTARRSMPGAAGSKERPRAESATASGSAASC